MIRRPPRSTLFPTRRSSDLQQQRCDGRDRLGHRINLEDRIRTYRAAARNVAMSECLQLHDATSTRDQRRSEEHTSELQSQSNLVCRLLLEKKKKKKRKEKKK